MVTEKPLASMYSKSLSESEILISSEKVLSNFYISTKGYPLRGNTALTGIRKSPVTLCIPFERLGAY